MKYWVLVVAIALAGCSGGKSNKTTPTGAATIVFNGLKMGALRDTLVQRVGAKPDRQTDDQLNYSDAMAEGVRWSEITYDFVGGKLARVTATQSGRDLAGYQKLYQTFTKRLGKPTQDVDSLTIWARRDAELALQPGSLLFSRR